MGMKKRLIAIALTMGSLAACGDSGGTTDHAIPEGNWDLMLNWTTGNCAGLGATYHINFDISDGPNGSFILTPGLGLTGDDLGGTMTCTTAVCTLDFTDSGAGGPLTNITTQTIHATIDEQIDDTLAGDGEATFDLDDGTSCTQSFNAVGDVI